MQCEVVFAIPMGHSFTVCNVSSEISYTWLWGMNAVLFKVQKQILQERPREMIARKGSHDTLSKIKIKNLASLHTLALLTSLDFANPKTNLKEDPTV